MMIMMKKSIIRPVALACLAVLISLAVVRVDGHGSCAFIDGAAPVEMELPAAALSNGLQDLSLNFVGLKPVVKRTTVPTGGKPRVIVHKYSSKPLLDYDSMTGTVTISANACGEGGDSAAAPGPSTILSKTSSSSALGALTTAAAAAAALATTSRNRLQTAVLAATAAAALYAVPTARAADVCDDTVEVLVEAPNAYLGAVEVCNAEVTVPGQCPMAFPSFPTCSNVPAECPVSVVGAGAGGLYTAMR